MIGAPVHCAICGTKTAAVLIDLRAYNEHAVPVWHCSVCDLSMPVLGVDRHLWVDEYAWEPPGFVYGNRMDDGLMCLGCEMGTMQAGIDFALTEIFPFWEARQPSWICYRCGFSDRAIRDNRHIWADQYGGWK